jgi:XTP/dITP diphosphohydrolase
MPSSNVIYLATNNAHKVGEIMRAVTLLGSPLRFENAASLGGMPEVDETGLTLVENARLKAVALRERAGCKAWVCADDTGLFVDALGGAPGVHTARYAGPEAKTVDNIAKLLGALKGLPPEKRGAEFRCCLLLLEPSGRERVFAGVFKGRIAETESGVNGFGYDPVFIPDGYDVPVAELGEDTKNRISHRALAVQALVRGTADESL